MSTKFNSEIYKSETKTSKLANSLGERKCSCIATWRQRRTHKLFKFEPSIARGRSVVPKRVLTGGPYKKRNGNPWLKIVCFMEWVCLSTKGVVVKKFPRTSNLYLYKVCNEKETTFLLICITLIALKHLLVALVLKKNRLFFHVQFPLFTHTKSLCLLTLS